MKKIILSLMMLASLIGCSPRTIEDEIKSEFKTYVFENFGNPDDFLEVIKIEVVDTVSTEMAKREVGALLATNDDLDQETDSLCTFYSDKMSELSKNLNRYAGLRGDQKAIRLLVAAYEATEEYIDYLSSAEAQAYKTAHERVEEALAVEDNVFIIQYKIRVRRLKNGEPVVCDYYCMYDESGIRFYDRAILMSDYPQSIISLYESIDKLADKAKIRQNYKMNNVSATRDWIQYAELWAD